MGEAERRKMPTWRCVVMGQPPFVVPPPPLCFRGRPLQEFKKDSRNEKRIVIPQRIRFMRHPTPEEEDFRCRTLSRRNRAECLRINFTAGEISAAGKE